MSCTYGENIKLSIYGQSHAPAIGMTLTGVPAGLSVDIEKLQDFLDRRAPGRNEFSTPRKEADKPEFMSGIKNNCTNGEKIWAEIKNNNTRSKDYDNLRDCPRPGHADYTALIKYGSSYDVSGGGPFSGRLTAPMCIAGGMCKQWLEDKGIFIAAHISNIADVEDSPVSLDYTNPDLSLINTDFPVVNKDAGKQMRDKIAEAKNDGDSVGGIIECFITGLPVGLGGPLFEGMEGRIAQIVYGIPAVKAIEFGAGFSCSYLRGSQNNDPFTVINGEIRTVTNNAGGILGGITNGMPLVFKAAFKPTPSISKPQQSISLSQMKECSLEIQGRHDPCIVPRAVPVVEAAAAVAIYDLILGNTQTARRK